MQGSFSFDVDLPLFALSFPYPVALDGEIGLTTGVPEPGMFFDAWVVLELPSSEEGGAVGSRRWPPLGKLMLEMKDKSRPSEHG